MKILQKLNINKYHIIAVIIALVIIIGALTLLYLKAISDDLLYFIIGISLLIGGLPFFVGLIVETRREREIETMFLEFSRNLVESVKAGTPISKSIFNIRSKDYGYLNPYIDKLANQIALGIPVKSAFQTFARDIGSKTITRSVTIIGEAEKAGGQIDDILESVVKSVTQIQKLRKERVSAMFTLVVQGYIIFFIFIIIMLVMQFKVLPIAASLGTGLEGADSGGGFGGLEKFIGGSERATPEQLARPFIWLLVLQGFFAGLVIGKLSEGSIRSGLKHSFVLVIVSLLIQTGAKVFIG